MGAPRVVPLEVGADAPSGLAGEDERRWLARAPLGARAWALLEDGRPLAWRAAPRRAVWMAGRERAFAELGDARPDAGLRAHDELWERAARAALGERDEGDFVHYAFPDEGAWLRGARFEGFDIVRTLHALVLERPRAGDAPAGVVELAAFDHQVRWLWERCAGAFGASAVRDAAHLAWRFEEGPGRSYRTFGVRDAAGVLRGFAAATRAPWLARRGATLVDWLVPPEEPEVGAALLRAVEAWAGAAGASSVTTALVEWSPWFERFQRSGFRVHPSPLFLVARSAARRFDHLWLRDHWWLTLADTTLV